MDKKIFVTSLASLLRLESNNEILVSHIVYQFSPQFVSNNQKKGNKYLKKSVLRNIISTQYPINGC